MEIPVRAAIVYVFVWVLTRALGRRELAEITTFELVLLVMMGDMVQQAITQEDMSVTGAVLAVGTMALLAVGTSYVGFRSRRARPVIDGRPVVIVRDGRLLGEVLALERLTDDEVLTGARQQGIGDLAEVRVGILEADGRFSFIRTDRAAPAEQRDREV